MDVTTDCINLCVDSGRYLRTDCANNGADANKETEQAPVNESSASIEKGSYLLYSDARSKERKRARLATTQLFQDFVSSVEEKLEDKKRVGKSLRHSAEEPKAAGRRIRYQKARKSTNPVQSANFPFLLCFASKAKSNGHRSNDETPNAADAGEVAPEDEDLVDSSKGSICDQMRDNNSVKIVTPENADNGSSDAVLELTFDEPKKDLDSKEAESNRSSVQIKKELSDEMLDNNSIKIVTQNDVQGSSDAILELTFGEPKKNSVNKTESDADLVKIKREVNDEALENNSIKIVTENDVQGSSDAILELTFDKPRKSSEERFHSHEDSMKVKKETINDEILEHNSIKIMTTENDLEGSSDAILELTFDEPKKMND